jgi:hypothetical protein
VSLIHRKSMEAPLARSGTTAPAGAGRP